jgi:predicted double-glycine peptidase
VPVIVAIQAWPSEPSPGRRWADEWEEGHYVAVVGVDDNSVTVEDPSLLGARGFIPTPEFLERWHGVDGMDRRWLQLGIAIEGATPATPRSLVRVE